MSNGSSVTHSTTNEPKSTTDAIRSGVNAEVKQATKPSQPKGSGSSPKPPSKPSK